MEATILFSYLIPIIICLIGVLALALYALRFWEFSSAQLFFLVAFTTLWAILAYLMQLLSPNVDQAWFWTRLRFSASRSLCHSYSCSHWTFSVGTHSGSRGW